MKLVQVMVSRARRTLTRQRGQVILLYALMSTVLIAMLGLALDLGFNYSQRRNLQNDTDAAVTVGLNQLRTAALASPPGSSNGTGSAVSANLTANSFPLPRSTTSSSLCEFVNNSDVQTGLCNAGTVPSGTSGVRVTVSETYPTFVMVVVGFATSSISASTTGHIQVASVGGDAPIVVCGDDTALSPSGSQWILKQNPISASNPTTTSPTEYYPAQLDTRTAPSGPIGMTFEIHGPQVQTCGTPTGNGFKGDLGQANTDVPDWFAYKPGTTAGPLRLRVSNGCTSVTGLTGCTIVLPIAENMDPATRVEYGTNGPGYSWWPTGTSTDGSCTGKTMPSFIGGSNKPICVVLWEAFTIVQQSANKHTGTLLNPQVITNLQANGSQNSWQIGDGVTQILVERVTS
jgi:hypothetical protein